MHRSAVILLIACVAFPVAAAAQTDFSVHPFGPTHVCRGHAMRIGVIVRKESEPADILTLSVKDLPPGAECSFEFWDKNRIYHEGQGVIELRVAAGTPPGDYALKIEAISRKQQVLRAAPYPITVDPAPQPLPRAPVRENPPIPLVERWEQQMLAEGKRQADPTAIARNASESGVWYYDGIRVFHQIADYTGDPSWLVAAGDVAKVYRDGYVIKNQGRIPGYRVFPHGMVEDYRRTQDDASRQAVLMLANQSAYARAGGGVNTALSRETAYCLNAYLAAEDLGEPRHARCAAAAEYALGHVEQWFVSKNFLAYEAKGSMPPFMVGLTCEALIGYYDRTKDPRVPHAVKRAMDWLWEHAWIERDESFYYRSEKPFDPIPADQKGAPDLNLLIAPAYAWLYHLTGAPIYRERGDRLFVGGVKGAWLGGGKQFSQNYRWSFDYVQWRRDIPVPDDKTAPRISDITVERGADGEATVRWKTDEPAVMQLRHGETEACGQEMPAGRYLVTSWCRKLAGLAAGKKHYVRITATDASGNASTSDAVAF